MLFDGIVLVSYLETLIFIITMNIIKITNLNIFNYVNTKSL